MEYTKGEWKAIDFKDTLDLFEQGHFQIVGNNQRSNVAIIPAHWDRAEANARLIAQAPRMYEALKQALENSHDPVVEKILMQALAEMEGN